MILRRIDGESSGALWSVVYSFHRYYSHVHSDQSGSSGQGLTYR